MVGGAEDVVVEAEGTNEGLADLPTVAQVVEGRQVKTAHLDGQHRFQRHDLAVALMCEADREAVTVNVRSSQESTR